MKRNWKALMIALVLCNRLKPVGSLNHCAIPMVVAGLLMLLPVLLAGPVLSQMGSQIPREVMDVVMPLLSQSLSTVAAAPVVMIILGVVCILTAVTLKLFFKKK